MQVLGHLTPIWLLIVVCNSICCQLVSNFTYRRTASFVFVLALVLVLVLFLVFSWFVLTFIYGCKDTPNSFLNEVFSVE